MWDSPALNSAVDGAKGADQRPPSMDSQKRALEPPQGGSLASQLSFKFYDSQSLQYSDKIPDGFYDIWGPFRGSDAPIFPSLEDFERAPYSDGEETEIIVVDRRRDARLRELEAKAKGLFSKEEAPAWEARAKELSRFVADCLGGAGPHGSLLEEYKRVSQQLKAERNGLTLLLGELPIGLSRHRSLLLKVLADSCGLPCRLVRGEFYLGPAGQGGELSVAMLHFNGQEWMVELVTELGRLFHVRTGPSSPGQLPYARSEDAASQRDSGDAGPMHTHGFPTLPSDSGKRSTSGGGGAVPSEPSSSDNSAGLQWSDLDGPTMDELGASTASERLSGSSKEQTLQYAGQQSPSSTDAERRAGRPSSVQKALSLDSDRMATLTEASAMLNAGLSGRQTSMPLPLEVAEPEASDSGVVHSEDRWTERDSSLARKPLSQRALPADVYAVRTGRFGSTLGTGPARARVRGRDARGRIVEFELEGLTVTHAHNLSLGNRSLDTISPSARVRRSEEQVRGHASLESMIGRHRYVRQARPSASLTGSSVRESGDSEGRNSATFARETRNFLARGQPQADAPRGRQALVEPPRRRSADEGDQPGTSAPARSSDAQAASSSGSRTAQPGTRQAVNQNDVLDLLKNVRVTQAANAAATAIPPNARPADADAKPAPAAAASEAAVGGRSSTDSTDEAEVNFDELELGPRIGIGCFGEVFKARWRQTTVAVKRLFAQSLDGSTIKEFKAEVLMNRRLKHPNVILFMGACTQPPNLSIITQWAPRGSLFSLLHSDKPGRPQLTLRQKLRMALDIARGMHYLHTAKPPVIHRDLKSMNLLVDNDLTIKVCDFGLARTRSSTWMTGTSQGGTPEWTAPEVLRSAQYNEKSDIYSYGVVLYELATGKEPWDDMTPMQVVGAVGWAGNRLEPPPGCPPIFAGLMEQCFRAAEERPSFETIIGDLLRFANKSRNPLSGGRDGSGETP